MVEGGSGEWGEQWETETEAVEGVLTGHKKGRTTSSGGLAAAAEVAMVTVVVSSKKAREGEVKLDRSRNLQFKAEAN